jgi:hypothetical protein
MPKNENLIHRYFCTLFDSNYLFKGVVMLHSLHQNCAGAEVYVLCMDEPCRQILEGLGLPGVKCISLPEIETAELLTVKKDRNMAEYCWTLSASFTAWVLGEFPDVDLLTYLDADLMFFSPVDVLFEEIGGASIAIIEHRFTSRLKYLEENGRFCVEWVSFRRDAEGLACLHKWRNQCIEWCYARLEDGRMGDQKYLDNWPMDYTSVHVIEHSGAGVAPWNYPNYSYLQDNLGRVTADGLPLIFYHFHQFHILHNGRFSRVSDFYLEGKDFPDVIYDQYESALKSVINDVRQISPGFSHGMKSESYVGSRRWVQRFLPRHLKEFLKRIVRY